MPLNDDLIVREDAFERIPSGPNLNWIPGSDDDCERAHSVDAVQMEAKSVVEASAGVPLAARPARTGTANSLLKNVPPIAGRASSLENRRG